MVAIINSGRYLHRALQYNEQKVKEQKAQCLLAANYPKDHCDLNFYQKLHRLTNQASLNTRTKVNSVHVSLNFAPGEKPDASTLTAIAESYMQQIGFGRQPYLVYQHTDAAHPHLHIVTTNIQADGKRISLHNLGKIESERARKNIEQTFQLVHATRTEKLHHERQPVQVAKAQYGTTCTKNAISHVITKVFNEYAFTSLPEYNAVLRLYNVEASRGTAGSRMFQRKGLVYRILNEQGQPVGVPIKASLFGCKPTLKGLEEKYDENASRKKRTARRLGSAIDWTLCGKKRSLPEWINDLAKQQIRVVLRQNKDGLVYGITYIDLQQKSVWNGSDLGKGYAAKAIQEKCIVAPSISLKKVQQVEVPKKVPDERMGSVCSVLNSSAPATDTLPAELRYTRRKRKRRRII